ncbi:MAG: adenylate/guanylate cyclase domain-containing protein [Georgfuchsia sp.]
MSSRNDNAVQRDCPRFIPRQMLQLLGIANIDDVQLGENIEKDVTLFFTDIRDFTALSSTMMSSDVFRFINSYLNTMEPVIERNNGVTDKYIGDAIMGIFPRSADDAIRAGIEILRRLVVYNEGRVRAGFVPIRIGIGINTGLAILGTIGGHGRMDTTVLGDAVNLASRIEGLTKRYSVQMLISEDTRSFLANPDMYRMRLVDRAFIRGQSFPQLLYEVFDADPDDIQKAKIETDDQLQEGISLYHLEEYVGALQRFMDCNNRLPSDGVSNAYIQECHRRISGESLAPRIHRLNGQPGLMDAEVETKQAKFLAVLASLRIASAINIEWLDRARSALETFHEYRTAEALLMSRFAYPFSHCHEIHHHAIAARLETLAETGATISAAKMRFNAVLLFDKVLNHFAKADHHLAHYIRRTVSQPTTGRILARS